MIGRLSGTISEFYDDSIILDVLGVGYLVYCTQTTISGFTHNANVVLQIQMVVREDNIMLFGFNAKEEKDWFNLLQTVQGVGAKMAMNILSNLSINRIQTAIAAQDQVAFKSINGIGPKLASRIINELKNKKELVITGNNNQNSVINNQTNDNIVNDAISALVNLGFNRSDAFATISKLHENNDNLELSELIRHALSKLTKA